MTGPGSKPNLRGEMAATDRLSKDAAQNYVFHVTYVQVICFCLAGNAHVVLQRRSTSRYLEKEKFVYCILTNTQNSDVLTLQQMARTQMYLCMYVHVCSLRMYVCKYVYTVCVFYVGMYVCFCSLCMYVCMLM